MYLSLSLCILALCAKLSAPLCAIYGSMRVVRVRSNFELQMKKSVLDKRNNRNHNDIIRVLF
jgi:hypothetical protein